MPNIQTSESATAIVRFQSTKGEILGASIDLPLSSNSRQLANVVNGLLANEEPMPYGFYLTETRTEITATLSDALRAISSSSENVISITYQPQALFRVRALSRCTSSLPGHEEAILTCNFSPDSKLIATGSGDTTVRLWNPESQIPHKTLAGHKNWILILAFSPDATVLASGSMDCTVRTWDPLTGTLVGKPLTGHRQWITSLAWQPYHVSAKCSRLVSGSKDGSLKIWNTAASTCFKTLAGHSAAVTCVKWSGEDVIYSASQDRTIKVWDTRTGLLLKNISGHGHWVNMMTLSTDYVLRCGAFPSLDESQEYTLKKLSENEAKVRYKKIKESSGNGKERMISGSDDFTLILWSDISNSSEKNVKPTVRMTGHQQLVNDVMFSPDGSLVASASFDKSVRLWDGFTGKFLFTFRGHVGPVYRISWSADSRLLLSASRDSTCKVWDIRTRKLKSDLPGHSDEVYTVDWSADGKKAVSAGKDKIVKIWHH